jgi:hypothetical protein
MQGLKQSVQLRAAGVVSPVKLLVSASPGCAHA